ncbi:MAG: peptide/nickel transport system permease protein [Thermomicrobiales bacterium]|nr:peptide/nickel transport system permease protein [Thermomicrobiales bacterium]
MAAALSDAVRSASPARTRSPRWRRIVSRRNAKGLVGAGIALVILLVALGAPLLTDHDPTKPHLVARLTPPAWQADGSWDHPLGTDNLGRDLWSRVVFGSRISLAVGLVSVVVAGIGGVLLGVLAGYFGGLLDHVIMRLADVQLAFPFLLLAIFVISVLRPNATNLIVVLAISGWVIYARMSRAATLSLREQDYVVAAKVLGASSPRVLLRHILPNAMPLVFVIVTYQVGQMILAESALSFLGLGVPPPTPTWGSIVGEGREYIDVAWWIITFPGIALMLTVVGLGFLGDWLRDRIDPTLRH